MHGAKVNRGKTRCNNIKGTDGVAMRGQKQGKKIKDVHTQWSVHDIFGGVSPVVRAFVHLPTVRKVDRVHSADPLTCYLNVNIRVWLRL